MKNILNIIRNFFKPNKFGPCNVPANEAYCKACVEEGWYTCDNTDVSVEQRYCKCWWCKDRVFKEASHERV